MNLHRLRRLEKLGMSIEELTDIIERCTTANNIGYEIAEFGLKPLMIPCLKSLKKGTPERKSLATKAIGLLAITVARGEHAHELMKNMVSTFSNIKTEEVTVNVLNCLAITTLAGASNFYETERSMKIIWNFICSFSKSKFKSEKNWAVIMATAISAWSLLFTTMDTERVVVLNFCWNGAMTRIIDMLQEEKRIQVACIEALAIICEKGCFEPFSGEEYYDNRNIQDWKNEILEQVITACGWRPEFTNFFEDDGVVNFPKNIFKCNLTLKSWSQLKKIEFIEDFCGDDFTVHMMKNKFIRHFFELGTHAYSFVPKLYEPVYKEVEEKRSLQNIRNVGGLHRRSLTSSVQKGRAISLNNRREEKLTTISNEKTVLQLGDIIIEANSKSLINKEERLNNWASGC